ncbi:MAG: hypothetical protein ACXWTR_03005 [Methylotenera sp.]
MAFIIALLVGIAIIAGIIAYWIVMLMLIILGIVFAFWAFLFAYLSGDPYIGGVCSVFATGLTFWLYITYSDRKKPTT